HAQVVVAPDVLHTRDIAVALLVGDVPDGGVVQVVADIQGGRAPTRTALAVKAWIDGIDALFGDDLRVGVADQASRLVDVGAVHQPGQHLARIPDDAALEVHRLGDRVEQALDIVGQDGVVADGEAHSALVVHENGVDA